MSSQNQWSDCTSCSVPSFFCTNEDEKVLVLRRSRIDSRRPDSRITFPASSFLKPNTCSSSIWIKTLQVPLGRMPYIAQSGDSTAGLCISVTFSALARLPGTCCGDCPMLVPVVLAGPEYRRYQCWRIIRSTHV